MEVNAVLQKIDFILKSETEESYCLFELINNYYKEAHKNSTEIIKCDFKKKEIVTFYEILKDDLGKGF